MTNLIGRRHKRWTRKADGVKPRVSVVDLPSDRIQTDHDGFTAKKTQVTSIHRLKEAGLRLQTIDGCSYFTELSTRTKRARSSGVGAKSKSPHAGELR
jgi:hypothetical protein